MSDFDRWHYPRELQAKRVLTDLEDGPFHAFRLFGPRRIGKTQFVVNDLAREAERSQRPVLYTNFWVSGFPPMALFLDAASKTLAGTSVYRQVRDKLPRLRTEAQFSFGGASVSVALDTLKAGDPTTIDIGARAFSDLADTRAVLLLDEFQAIADAPDGRDALSFFRAQIERHRKALAVVYLGSDETRLRTLFEGSRSPFANSSHPLELDPLTEDFVTHQLGAYRQHYGRSAEEAEALRPVANAVLERYRNVPQMLQAWLMRMGNAARNGEALEPEAGLLATERHMWSERGFDRMWDGFTDHDRAAVLLIWAGVPRIYAAGPQALALGAPDWTRKSVENAIKKLRRRALIANAKRATPYRIVDRMFEGWLEAQDLERPSLGEEAQP